MSDIILAMPDLSERRVLLSPDFGSRLSERMIIPENIRVLEVGGSLAIIDKVERIIQRAAPTAQVTHYETAKDALQALKTAKEETIPFDRAIIILMDRQFAGINIIEYLKKRGMDPSSIALYSAHHYDYAAEGLSVAFFA